MTSSSTTTGPRGVPRGWLLAAGLVALSYFLYQSGGRSQRAGQCHGRCVAAQLPDRVLPLQPLALLAVSVVLHAPGASASAPTGELYDVRPARLRTVPARVCSRSRGRHPQVVPLQRHILRSSHRDIRPAARVVEGAGCLRRTAVTDPQSRTRRQTPYSAPAMCRFSRWCSGPTAQHTKIAEYTPWMVEERHLSRIIEILL
jgi:hypothetical protein